MSDEISLREKLSALFRLSKFSPGLSVLIIFLTTVAAVLEGIGLSFLLPIIDSTSSNQGETGGYVDVFVTVYDFLGLPFELSYIIVGVAFVMLVRFSMTYLSVWFKSQLQAEYVRHLQAESYQKALDARISYFDDEGSDDILNVIVTQARKAGKSLSLALKLFNQVTMSLVYFAIALIIAPELTVLTVVFLGGLVTLTRRVFESAYSVGDRTAEANERIQTAVQAGTQGIRDVKLFGMSDEVFSDFREAADQYVEASVSLNRNQAAMDNLYRMIAAVTVFVLIWFAITQTTLTIGGIAVFLFAMFRLAPRASQLNTLAYKLDGFIPHLYRTQQFIDELEAKKEPDAGREPVPEPVERIAFEDVSFAYESDEQVLDGISFSFAREDFVAFVGSSGAGKSTIVSLLTRMYDPDSGTISANGTPIEEFDIDEWREHVAVVRQHPFIFNDTLRYNLTIGNRSVSHDRLEAVCEIAQVTEFFDELPNGYDTVLGEDGVRLSGGQRQRIALARALLKDSDLLILDEATSDLDTTLEKRVHDGIEQMDHDRALLVIAHRLSTVRNADRIYTMSDGQITETGPHERLVEQGGTYANLYAKQSR